MNRPAHASFGCPYSTSLPHRMHQSCDVQWFTNPAHTCAQCVTSRYCTVTPCSWAVEAAARYQQAVLQLHPQLAWRLPLQLHRCPQHSRAGRQPRCCPQDVVHVHRGVPLQRLDYHSKVACRHTQQQQQQQRQCVNFVQMGAKCAALRMPRTCCVCCPCCQRHPKGGSDVTTAANLPAATHLPAAAAARW